MENRISVIGLGYVGLPLAIEFSKQYKVVGFDIDKSRVKQLKDQDDKTGEIDISTLNKVFGNAEFQKWKQELASEVNNVFNGKIELEINHTNNK